MSKSTKREDFIIPFCTHCGKEALEGAAVCLGCGCKLPKVRPAAAQGEGVELGTMAVFRVCLTYLGKFLSVLSLLFCFMSITLGAVGSNNYLYTNETYAIVALILAGCGCAAAIAGAVLRIIRLSRPGVMQKLLPSLTPCLCSGVMVGLAIHLLLMV